MDIIQVIPTVNEIYAKYEDDESFWYERIYYLGLTSSGVMYPYGLRRNKCYMDCPNIDGFVGILTAEDYEKEIGELIFVKKGNEL